MTTSEYSYATVTNIEAFTGINYETLHASFTDIVVEAKITMAERMVNGYLGVDGAVTATDGVIMATIIIAAKILRNNITALGVYGNEEQQIEIITMSIPAILRTFLQTDVGVDAIPMSGADR